MDIVPEAGNYVEYQGMATPILVTSVNFDRGFFSGINYEEATAPIEMYAFQLSKIERIIDFYTAQARLSSAAPRNQAQPRREGLSA